VDGDGDLDLIVVNGGGVLASGEETGSITVLINDWNGRGSATGTLFTSHFLD
jgi:hypothetical protein